MKRVYPPEMNGEVYDHSLTLMEITHLIECGTKKSSISVNDIEFVIAFHDVAILFSFIITSSDFSNSLFVMWSL